MKINMNILDLKTLSKENLNKIHLVLETIGAALEIGKIENGTFLIPKSNFEDRHIAISEVQGVLAKIANEKSGLIVVVPHENPYPPDKRLELPPSAGDSPFREPFEHKQASYEREKQRYEETYSKNIELCISDARKFRMLSEDVEKIVNNQEKERRAKQRAALIEEIICVRPENGGNVFKMVINGDYERPLAGDKAKPTWSLLFQLSEKGEISYAPLVNKSSLDYLNSNKNNKLYTKTGHNLTKILKVEGENIVPNIRLEVITEKAYQTRVNKSKSA